MNVCINSHSWTFGGYHVACGKHAGYAFFYGNKGRWNLQAGCVQVSIVLMVCEP